MQGRKHICVKENIRLMLIGIAFLWVLWNPQICYAEIASDNAFDNAVWELVHEENREAPVGVVQSICATEDYIICIENYSDFTNDPDIVSAYYRNTTDENGNPVEQYSLAKQVAETNYEHSNGMAYNPNTGEIYVALYTSKDPENRGCLYVMDPNTLTYKNKIKVSNDYNILGIDYMKDLNQYVIQTDAAGGYSFKILDADFQMVEDLGNYADTAKGDNFQDLCVSGDYIINFPLTFGMGIGDFINMYSISRKTMVSDPQLDFNFENVVADEPESICELEPGVFMAAVNVDLADGSRKLYLYTTKVPYNFTVTTATKNGTISESTNTALRGESVPINYTPDKDYKLSSLTVNGKSIDIAAYPSQYVIKDVQSNQTVEVSFVEMTFRDKAAGIFKKFSLSQDDSRSEKETAGKIIAVLVILVLLGSAFAVYLRILYVRRMRALKRRQAYRRRRQVISQMEWETTEDKDLD